MTDRPQNATSPRAVAVFLQAVALCLRNSQTPASNRDLAGLVQERAQTAARASVGLKLSEQDAVRICQMADTLAHHLTHPDFAIADPPEGSA